MKKWFYAIFIRTPLLLGILFYSSSAMSETMTSQNLLTIENIRLVTDNVMGGVSNGEIKRGAKNGSNCVLLSGDVSTENNGGFIQAALDITSAEPEKLTMADGVMLKVLGNGEQYNVHLRTTNLWFPWQAYRATFKTDGQWQHITIPFKNFIPYKTSSGLNPEKIKRIGIVAIGRDFKAEICISELGFYKADFENN